MSKVRPVWTRREERDASKRRGDGRRVRGGLCFLPPSKTRLPTPRVDPVDK